MTPLFAIMAALWALEDVLRTQPLTETERDALIDAVSKTILKKRRRKLKV
jgi:hypothetical protein